MVLFVWIPFQKAWKPVMLNGKTIEKQRNWLKRQGYCTLIVKRH